MKISTPFLSLIIKFSHCSFQWCIILLGFLWLMRILRSAKFGRWCEKLLALWCHNYDHIRHYYECKLLISAAITTRPIANAKSSTAFKSRFGFFSGFPSCTTCFHVLIITVMSHEDRIFRSETLMRYNFRTLQDVSISFLQHFLRSLETTHKIDG